MKLFKKNQLALLLPLLVVGCAGKGGFDPLVIENDDFGSVAKTSEESKSKKTSKPLTPTPPKPLTSPKTPTPYKPVSPTNPLDPTVVVKPINPVAPVSPTVPTHPKSPSSPTTLDLPIAPVAPLSPANPATPILPAVPVVPETPVVPTEPTKPVSPIVPIIPDSPALPVNPVAPENPGVSVTPVNVTTPDDSEVSDNPDKIDSTDNVSESTTAELIVTPGLLGWSLDITRRNKARFKEDGTKYEDVKRVRTDEVVIDFPGQAEGSLAIDPQKIKFDQTAFEPSSGFENIHIGFENYSTSAKNDIYKGELGREHQVYVGDVGTLRYQANNTAKALPETNKEFTYKGIWAYMTDIDVLREELAPPSEAGETVTWTSNGRTSGVDYSGSSEFDDVVRKRSDFSDTVKGSDGKTKYKDKGHFAEFKVNFGDKKLTGALSRTPRLPGEVHNAYTIDAKINSHRFSGTATVHPLEDEINYNNLYFKENAQNVEGGFYGETGQELAGSFLADDNSIAVAFGAKRQDKLDENTQLTRLFDGVRINVDNNEDFTPFALNNVYGSNYLFVDGYNIPLVKDDFVSSKSVKTADGEIRVNYCCNQFEHMIFGEINHTSTRHKDITNYDNEYDEYYYEDEVPNFEEDTNKYAEGRYFKDKYYIEKGYQDGNKLKYTPFNRSLFLQGERSKDIPKEGTVKYQGSWQANIVHRNIPHSVTPDSFDEGTRAAFEANFNDKKLTGQLWRKGDILKSPSVLIDADIKGVGFEGTAKTGEYGITIDPDRTLNNQALRFKVPTQGLFYGENAAELGGSFSFSGISYKDKEEDENRVYDKVGAVYGAKKVSEQK